MNKLLDNKIEQQVRDVLTNMINPVKVMFFGSDQQDRCEYCEDTKTLLSEVSALSEKIDFEAFSIEQEPDTASKYGVEKIPTTVIAAVKDGSIIDYGIRLSGIPAGHEFNTLINDLILVSSQESGLSQKSREFLKQLDSPVHMMVFVTPTCPYCPQAVILAHRMALESPMVTAEMVEAMEFPELSERFDVSGVPQTTINDGAGTLVGAAPEERLLNEIKKALLN
ncbi:MAG TPA: thioredoxin family protein [Anaerolineaceae bacterium]